MMEWKWNNESVDGRGGEEDESEYSDREYIMPSMDIYTAPRSE